MDGRVREEEWEMVDAIKWGPGSYLLIPPTQV